MTKFYQYRDSYSSIRPFTSGSAEEFYMRVITKAHEESLSSTATAITWEYNWRMDRRPYYRVYPKVCAALSRLNIDRVVCSSLKPPSGQRSMIIDMPYGNKMLESGEDIQHLMLDFSGEHVTGAGLLAVGVYYGDRFDRDIVPDGLPSWDVWHFRAETDETVGAEMERVFAAETTLDSKKKYQEEGLYFLSCIEQRRATALAISLSMLGEDSDLVRPEVLSADEIRASIANREALADKARRRGKVGWSVGAGIETSPHIRVPHPALYHVGPGRKEQVILFRAGSVVHRSKIEQVPTGYHDKESGDEV